MVQKLDLQQAKKAISALFKYNESKSDNDMLNSEEENAIYVEITTHKIMNKAQINKKKVALTSSPFPEDIEVCYITKDKESDIEEKVKSGSITQIKKVIHYKNLGTTYKAYEAKRKLADSYDLFMVDDRIVHLMPGLLGGKFFAKNKAPVVIKATGSLKNQVEKALKATYVKLHNGLNTLVLIGNFGMSEASVLDNYKAAVPEIVKITAHSWDQVQILGIKSQASPLLPIHTALPKGEGSEKKDAAAPKKADKAAPVKKADKAVPAKKDTKTKAEPTKAPVKKAAAPAKKAAAPAKKAAAPAKKATAVAPAKKSETKKVTKKAAPKSKK